ncbi:MAG: RNA 2',3'-cyclic phosphodiesterase [Chloroflexi bacterium]|nr:RNA 2',3'-cyclic phosphodiesterase [Chloroflexota bacterium]
MGEIRAFIAIELPDEVKNELSEILYKLKPGREKAVKWVNPNSIHLTLKFLGNIPEERIVDITHAIAKASSLTFPFNLELKGLGAFPNLKSPRVVWVGIGGDLPIITNLQRQIDQSLIPLGFSPEKRDFSPHLTLGRVRDKTSKNERYELGKTVESLEIPKSASFSADRFSLMQSTLTNNGAIYSQIEAFMLDRN